MKSIEILTLVLTGVCICLIGVTIISMVVYSYYYYQEYSKQIKQFESYLEQQAITIQISLVKSPAVEIEIKSREGFLQKIRELNTTVVYVEKEYTIKANYWIFTPDYNIGYSYKFELE